MAFSDSAREKEYKRQWYLQNRPRVLEARRADYASNQEAKKQRAREYYATHKEECLKRNSARMKIRRKHDPKVRLLSNLRKRVYDALSGRDKSASTLALIGCTVDELRAYLQAKFAPGMSWENYGKWHIDHIMPCASFDLSDRVQQLQCFNYKNLQPLWAVENIRKGAKVPSEWQVAR